MNEAFDEILKDIPTKSSRSKLETCTSLIMELRRRRRTYREIASVLLERCGMHVSVSTLHFFVKRQALLARRRNRSDTAGTVEGKCDGEDHRPTLTKPQCAGRELGERVAALKRQVPPPAVPEPFQYDPSQPLRVARKPGAESTELRPDSLE